jgi:catechol 2,3-dioxygenase-like lactoylglutathione lyase family enzyme
MEDIVMLGSTNASANVAVGDIEIARRFYQDTLGLTPVDAKGQEVIVFRSGDTRLNVYRSQYAGSNQATAVTWAVGDRVDAIARALKEKGVTFEHYDMPGITLDGDVHVGHGMRVAWFKDPDGNILNLISS